MHKRLVPTAILGITLLLSQGANVLVAALCPHLRSPAVSCITEIPEPEPEVCHEHNGQMETQTDSTKSEFVSEEPSESSETSEHFALTQPGRTCPHCAMHSRSNSNLASFREVETIKRARDLNTPLLVEPIVTEHESVAPVITSRAHGPPGDQLPRHILINIYRI